MEIVRLTYCEYTFKGAYKLINIGDVYYWKKIQHRQYWDNWSEMSPLYISSKDNRYLAFTYGVHEIRFEEDDL